MTVLEALIKGQCSNDKERISNIDKQIKSLDYDLEQMVQVYAKKRTELEKEKLSIESRVYAGMNYRSWLGAA